MPDHPIADDPFAGRPPGDTPPDDGPVPTLVAAAWQQAEARLYPTLTERPDLYQRIVLLVRGTVDRLRELGPSTTALIAAAERGAELVAEVVDATGVSGDELDLDLVARAALAMRHREVRGEQSLLRRLRLLAEARGAERPWVVLEEVGHFAGDPFLPYRRLEAEVATGRTLLVSAAADDDFATVTHSVTVLQMDLATGVLQRTELAQPAATFGDAAMREAAADALKATR